MARCWGAKPLRRLRQLAQSGRLPLVHGFAAGGSTDIVARIVAEGLGRHLGQQVIVEARPGAGSTTATGQVARAAPDGYTVILLTGSNPIAAAHVPKPSLQDDR